VAKTQRFPAGFVSAIAATTGVTRGRVYQVLSRAPVSVRAVARALGTVESLKAQGLTPMNAVDRLLASGGEGHQAWFTYSLAGRRRAVARWQVSWLGVLILYAGYYDITDGRV